MLSKKNAPLSIKKIVVRAFPLLILSIVWVQFISKLFPENEHLKNIPLNSFTSYIDTRIQESMKKYNIPGATLALIKSGETVWVQAYGSADLETGRKMTVDTYVRVQSISKPVTAWGIMKLVEEGQIDLDTPIVQYIKNWKFPQSEFEENEITARQLLSHTAGLPIGDFYNYFSPVDDLPTLEESLSKEAVPMMEPGMAFSYSNTGFNLLELLIEEVTGRDFAEYMSKEILIPLGMNHSSFEWSENLQPAVPFGYNLNGEAISVYVYPEKGSGGLFSTVSDIATFVSAGMPGFSQSQKVLNAQSIHQLYTPAITRLGVYNLVFSSYGLGYYLENLSNGNQAISHGGQGTGWMTHFHSVPETGDGIVILTNSQRSWPFIANILREWSEWNDFAPIGMSRILTGQKVIWAFSGLNLIIVYWQILPLAGGLYQKKLVPVVPTRNSHFSHFIRLGLSIIITAALLWNKSQTYSFISSVFPVAANWLEISLFALALSSLLSAIFTSKKLEDLPKEGKSDE